MSGTNAQVVRTHATRVSSRTFAAAGKNPDLLCMTGIEDITKKKCVRGKSGSGMPTASSKATASNMRT